MKKLFVVISFVILPYLLLANGLSSENKSTKPLFKAFKIHKDANEKQNYKSLLYDQNDKFGVYDKKNIKTIFYQNAKLSNEYSLKKTLSQKSLHQAIYYDAWNNNFFKEKFYYNSDNLTILIEKYLHDKVQNTDSLLYKTYYKYNSIGKPIEIKFTDRDGRIINKQVYEYYKDSLISTSEYYIFDFNQNDLIIIYKYVATYNSFDQIVEEIYYDYDVNSNMLKPSYRYTYNYDYDPTNLFIKEYISYYYDSTYLPDNWKPAYKSEYRIYLNQNAGLALQYEANNNIWTPLEKDTFHFNSDFDVIWGINQTWDSLSGWLNNSKYEYSYAAPSKWTLALIYSYDNINQQWVYQSKSERDFIADIWLNLEDRFFVYYQNLSSFVLTYKRSYIYNQSLKLISDKEFYASYNYQIYLRYEKKYDYDNDGDLIEFTAYEFTENQDTLLTNNYLNYNFNKNFYVFSGQNVKLFYQPLVSNKEIIEKPISYNLEQNYPNPFNPTTTISFSIAENARVKLTIYDVLGKEVATLIDEFKNPGVYRYEFNASNLASGIYFYKLTANNFTALRKMMLLK